MKRTTAFGVFVLTLAVAMAGAAAPDVFAQDPKGGGGGGGQGAVGGGADRGGGVTSGSGPVSSGAGPAGGGSFGGGSSGGMSGGSAGGGMMGGSPGMSAIPRGAGRTFDGTGGRRVGGGAAAEREGRAVQGSSFRRSAVDDEVAGRARTGSGGSGVESSIPWYARSRGGNPATGTAAPRPEVPGNRPPGVGGGYPGYPGYPGYYPGYPGYYPGYGYGGYYDCYYYPSSCWSPWGYGAFGLGYFYYNPFGWNYGDYAWGFGGGGGGSYGGQQLGSIRLRVKPNTASVYVDGYYAGTVDDFDNSFQKLSIALGTHKIEISAPGYQPLIFEIDVRDFDTINYQGELVPIR